MYCFDIGGTHLLDHLELNLKLLKMIKTSLRLDLALSKLEEYEQDLTN